MDRRRVVTGTRDGKEAVVEDSQLPSMDLNGVTVVPIWRIETLPTLPVEGIMDEGIGFPPPGGLWMATATIPPKATWLSGPVDFDNARPGFHSTDSVDIDYVIAGEVTLEGEDGAEVTLGSGETVVINGTGHAWHNRSEMPATLLLTVYGTKPAGER